MHIIRQTFNAPEPLRRWLHPLARLGLGLGIAGAALATAPLQAIAATTSFDYGQSISNPVAPDAQLGSYPWATVVLDDEGSLAGSLGDGIFQMVIIPNFSPYPPDTSTPSITQLAFSIKDFKKSDTYSFISPTFCTTTSTTTPKTTCDGSFGITTKGPDEVGVVGAGASGLNKQGFDLLVNLPPPGVKLDVSQGSITLFIKGPSGFSVTAFNQACSNGIVPDPVTGACPAGSYKTVAKVQELINSGSTVIADGGNGNQIPPDPPGQSVPGPLPILGATAALAFSRRLRLRQRNHRTTTHSAVVV